MIIEVMDRYTIKLPNEKQQGTSSGKDGKTLRQVTIESLNGVVVIEEILRLKSVLKLENQTAENLLDALKKLNKKIPSRDVLKSTKIGHTINKLTKHENEEVQQLSVKIVKEWKKFFEDKLDKPMMEVKCDHQTEKLRKAGRKLLAGALGVGESHSLPEAIEREAFFQHGRLINIKYRVSMRSLVFTLKNQKDIRDKVLNHQIEITDFVTMYKKETKK